MRSSPENPELWRITALLLDRSQPRETMAKNDAEKSSDKTYGVNKNASRFDTRL